MNFQVQLLTYECLGEARRATNALEREKQLREIAANVKEKHLQALKEVENAKALLLKEAQERERAELKAQKEFLEKKELIDTLLLSDKRYRRYTVAEIEIATNFFSENNIIGEGGYGKVYKCNLDHTPVAVKVLCPDAADKKDEFLTEVVSNTFFLLILFQKILKTFAAMSVTVILLFQLHATTNICC